MTVNDKLMVRIGAQEKGLTMAHVIKRKNGYELRVKDVKNENGKPVYKTRFVYPPRGISNARLEVFLEDELEAFQNEVESGTEITSYSTFTEAAEFWMANEGVNRLAPKTFERYGQLLGRVYDSPIGKMRISKIGPQDLNSFYRELAKPGANKHNGNPLSSKTIREHHNVISKILGTAWKWGVVKENVAMRADPPKLESVEIDFLDDDEITLVLRELENAPEKYKVMISMLIMFGFRRGELLGLEWKDVDFAKHRISIKRTSQSVGGKLITKDPKTARSRRDVTMDEYSESLLKDYKDWYAYKKEMAGDAWVNSGRLFIQDDGTPMHPDSVGDWWDKFQEKIGLTHHSLHSLRHTNASILIANNTDVATVAGRLGHANANTTLKVYTHQFRNRDENAARMMGRFVRRAVSDQSPNNFETVRL